MSSEKTEKDLAKDLKKGENAGKDDPQWASGLKRLYDQVVDEPLPDNFKDLLSKLDENGGK
ncbi:NepR family anti-sigma factor [Aurantiacibacter gangjinensis]|uniref:Anti-sigma factor NepR domain-containing protein n=1 Tax=Aurantiacibacter gangjinensis TaxID=502682 RepID=A0A0G9MK92_9SPHN|nr:NepR family anti-sigma factor [Aurantiacibacter gangjinensis]APE29343.1 hypothetical protein BMF35_b0088 [Aurantiacibacter gangjinensis]KLE31074.1 hypothetical protein AAW01_12570 [Aurantiacibacter gangjinensis]